MVASAKEPVNVAEIVLGSGPFGTDEIHKLEEALLYGQCTELRQATTALQAWHGASTAVRMKAAVLR